MRRPATAEEVLAWLNDFGHTVHFQDLSARVLREKNRVILQYRGSSGALATVGGRDLRGAVLKAAIRRATTSQVPVRVVVRLSNNGER
jgi:hypothetical protein